MISLIALCILGAFVAAILAAVWGKDKGQAGEMQIYNVLEQLEGQKAIISNCYLPLKDSGTTEVDLILIHESGIYVIESKTIAVGFLAVRIISIGRKVCQTIADKPKSISFITRFGKTKRTYDA